ncbi:ABC transporter permease subunit [Alkalibacterium olivapovliticus]|uniref:ABC-2 family transporter n=1 Tax=Alkalibacterium olivapovliticus TaxID=99907 RepID=A0A2T0VVY7_9LACT|nr:ABC transporter permease subunit [Alkalibacterium olivapovliticus]PRY75912.1 ABC-2 family transporter [Alkalibacterium olivapovliticus]
MKEYILFETKLYVKNRKNLFLILGVAVFVLGLLFYIPYQRVENIDDKIESEALAVRNAIAYVPLHEVEQGTYSDEYGYYDHLLSESSAIASQEVAITMFDDLNQYVTAGLQVTDSRIQSHEEGYGSLPQEFIVPLAQSLREREVYEYLQENNLQIEPNAENGANMLVIGIRWFSAVCFLFILFLSCDILTNDNEHKTIISAYPIDANRRLIGKLIIQSLVTIVALTSLFAAGYLISSLFFDIGTMTYPVPIYLSGEFTAVPTSIFIFTFIVLFLFFMIHMILFSALLNVLFRNKYLNIFIGGLLYILSFLFSSQVSFFRFAPINYFDPAAVLRGDLAVQFNQSSNDWITAIIILGLWSAGYAAILSFVFARKNRVKLEQIKGGSAA